MLAADCGAVHAVRARSSRCSSSSCSRRSGCSKFEEQFPEAIDLLARALRAGPRVHHRALDGRRRKCPSRSAPSSSWLYDRQNFGMPLPDALRDLGRRVPLHRRALLRHRRADAARGRRQPVGSARQPRRGRSASASGQAPGPRHHGARRASPAGCSRRCRPRSAAIMTHHVAQAHERAAGRIRPASRWSSAPSFCRSSARSSFASS